LFYLANPLGGEQEVAASETPATRFGSTLITLARALERLHEILQHPAVQTAYGQSADQPADATSAATGPAGTAVTATVNPVGSVEPAATGEPAAGEEADAQRPPPLRPHGHEPLITRPASSHIPAPVGERAKRSIPQDVKIAVSARDGGRCRQCGSTHQLHFDHVIPISRGGANTVANIQLLCGACNRAKGAKLK
jgi:hypothetical protein